MDYWADLTKAVEMTLAAERIRTPVFVRYTVVLAEKVEEFNQTLIKLVNDLTGWFSAVPDTVYALGLPDAGQITVTLEYPAGQTALLALSCGQPRSEVDLILLGTKGAIYHHQDHHPAFYPSLDEALEEPVTVQGQAVLAAIKQSLQLKKPVDLLTIDDDDVLSDGKAAR